MADTWSSWAATDAGALRDSNEDAYVDTAAARLWAVADGAGGHDHGAFASASLKAALERPGTELGPARIAELRARIATVHQSMLDRACDETTQRGVASTIASTLVILCAAGSAYHCLWCGDSRAYLLRHGALTRLSRDHSVVQELVDAGVVDPSEAETHPVAHLLTRAIGARPEPVELDEVTGNAQPGDRFVLCSDGLFKALDEGTIAQLAACGEPARALVAAALSRQAQDNVTAVVVERGHDGHDGHDA